MSNLKLKTTSGGSVQLTPTDTAHLDQYVNVATLLVMTFDD